MRRLYLVSLALLSLVACENTGSQKKFTVSGTVENHDAHKIYLEKVPVGSTQSMTMDSATIGKDGKFSLSTESGESVVYNLRLDKGEYPIASVINDTDKVVLNVKMRKENNQFTESYDVKGSPVSERMRDFVIKINNELQRVYVSAVKVDSLHKGHASDSVIAPIESEWKSQADNVKSYAVESMNKSGDPALMIFELGYYESMARNSGLGLSPLPKETLTELMSTASIKFPSHEGLKIVKSQIEEMIRSAEASTWVGKEAPDFVLPDPNGKEIKLSSFRGKYVLVDFWASWCGPCRAENPNVVKVHSQFKNKNFTVLGVSLDKPGEKDKWLKAVKDDQLLWTQVSDLQHWNSAVVPVYHIEGIPFNVLVDPQGKVIAEGLRGSALERKLQEVLQ